MFENRVSKANEIWQNSEVLFCYKCSNYSKTFSKTYSYMWEYNKNNFTIFSKINSNIEKLQEQYVFIFQYYVNFWTINSKVKGFVTFRLATLTIDNINQR